MEIFLRLLIAHLLGDFVLQSEKWVLAKEKRKILAPQLYVHTLIHIALNFLLLWNVSLWYWAVIIGLTHLLIDVMKIYLQKEDSRRLWFFIDQALHLAVLLAVSLIIKGGVSWPDWQTRDLAIFSALIFLTQPAAILIRTLISVYTPKTEIGADESLSNAGKYIGILERLLVFIFIITGHWEGVGFLIAAKSIFRFSDLSESKDRKLTEYILIGTLISFTLAIITAILVLRF
ncbi:DUF3307 domain-containing protein [Robertkochia aurantiaca]|uniref:DUF3307 domain-containing protein n=1 Tax=Robertkochia aurantiaca TaxID=2873700 RepID=UPI001CCB6A3B|nr:DUF3307 domain-containing protein [Robertkochia sp. 3YJGBD-33]